MCTLLHAEKRVCMYGQGLNMMNHIVRQKQHLPNIFSHAKVVHLLTVLFLIEKGNLQG